MSNSLTTAPTGHHRLAPSRAKKWIPCAGSLLAEDLYPDQETGYAREGSAAHEYAARALLTGGKVSQEWTSVDYPEWPCTSEMARAVQVYVDQVQRSWPFCEVLWTESKVEIPSELTGLPEPLGGTSDAGGVDYENGALHVLDLKFGRGVFVPADTEQFRVYALAAYWSLSAEDRERVSQVCMTAVQPRYPAGDGGIRSTTFALKELIEWGRDVLIPAAHAALKVDAPRVAGPWCMDGFCKARQDCPAFRGYATERTPFPVEPLPEGPPPVVPLAEIPASEVAGIWARLPALEAWMKDFRVMVQQRLEAGERLPGLARKYGRAGNRKWIDEEEVAEWVRREVPDPKKCFTAPAVLSPAQMEKTLRGQGVLLPATLITQSPPGLVVCAEDDPEAVPSSSEDRVNHFPIETENQNV